jgi:hypothetical protein
MESVLTPNSQPRENEEYMTRKTRLIKIEKGEGCGTTLTTNPEYSYFCFTSSLLLVYMLKYKYPPESSCECR